MTWAKVGVSQWVSRIGLALFVVGITVFAVSGSRGNYRLTGAALTELAQKVRNDQRATLMPRIASLKDRYYGSIGDFLRDVDGKISEANEQLADSTKIWSYDRGLYRYAAVRSATTGFVPGNKKLLFFLSLVLAAVGAIIYVLPRAWSESAGIKNDGIMFSSSRSRGWLGITIGGAFIGFYIALYFYPEYIVNWISLGDPLSWSLRHQAADRWFFYGMLYTFAVLVMGVRKLVNYRHNRYHIVRTASVMFFQLGFAFLIPAVLTALNQPVYDFKTAWPLDYSFFYSYRMDELTAGGAFGWFVLFWGLGLALILVPALAVLVGKRWYCSWVCGCGGLAETLGDPFRHLSDKSLKAWRYERWIVHGVLVFAVVMTVIVITNVVSARVGDPLLGDATQRVQSWYGFLIGSMFSGVVGTGFYPLMGNRVWCRFGCPLAAILGLVQKFKSRFRITVNGGQCISCGNCSTYCEMGIDVRWYAQRGQNIIRGSCVGCGICAAVCPRGVLRLENGPQTGRYNETSLLQLGGGRIDT